MSTKYRNSGWFLKFILLSLLLVGLASGVLLVQQKQNVNKMAAVSCSYYNGKPRDCNRIAGCSYKYCNNLSRTTCSQYSSFGCVVEGLYCGYKGEGNMGPGFCIGTPSQICTPGTTRCEYAADPNFGYLTRCATDGSGWQLVQPECVYGCVQDANGARCR